MRNIAVLSLGVIIVPVLARVYDSESAYDLYRRDYEEFLHDLYIRDANLDVDWLSRDADQFDFPGQAIYARVSDDLDEYLLKRDRRDAIVYARSEPEQQRKGSDPPPNPNPRKNPNLFILPPGPSKKDKKADTGTMSDTDKLPTVEGPRQEPQTPQHQIMAGTPTTPRTPFSPRERGHQRSTLSLSGYQLHHRPKSPKALAAIHAASGGDRATGPSPLSNQRYETNAFDAYQGPPPAEQGRRAGSTSQTSPSGLRNSRSENQRSRSDSMGSIPMDLAYSPPPSPSSKNLRRRTDTASTHKEQIKDHTDGAGSIDKKSNGEFKSVRYEDTVPATQVMGTPKVQRHEPKGCGLGKACSTGRKKLVNLLTGGKTASQTPPNKEAGNGVQARDLIGDEEEFDLWSREAEIDDWDMVLQNLQARLAADEDWNSDDTLSGLDTRNVDVDDWDDSLTAFEARDSFANPQAWATINDNEDY